MDKSRLDALLESLGKDIDDATVLHVSASTTTSGGEASSKIVLSTEISAQDGVVVAEGSVLAEAEAEAAPGGTATVSTEAVVESPIGEVIESDVDEATGEKPVATSFLEFKEVIGLDGVDVETIDVGELTLSVEDLQDAGAWIGLSS